MVSVQEFSPLTRVAHRPEREFLGRLDGEPSRCALLHIFSQVTGCRRHARSSRRLTAPSSTLAPLYNPRSFVSSRGEWLEPVHTRHEDHARRADGRHVLRVVPGAAGKQLVPRAQRAGRRAKWRRATRGCVGAACHVRRGAERARSCRCRARSRCARGSMARVQLLDGARGSRSRSSSVATTRPGMTFAPPGWIVMRPTVPTCRPGIDVTAACTASTNRAAASSASCRSAIGVVPACEATPSNVTSQYRMPTIPSTMPMSHRTALQHAALLDVQLEVRRAAAGREHGIGQPIGSPPSRRMPSPNVNPLTGRACQLGGVQPAGDRLAADEPAFLVLEIDDLERMAKRASPLGERPRDLERGEHAQRAVVAAAVGHRVGVRPDDDRRRARGSRPSSRRTCCRRRRRGRRGPAARIQSRTTSRAFRSSSLYAGRCTPPAVVAPIAARSAKPASRSAPVDRAMPWLTHRRPATARTAARHRAALRPRVAAARRQRDEREHRPRSRSAPRCPTFRSLHDCGAQGSSVATDAPESDMYATVSLARHDARERARRRVTIGRRPSDSSTPGKSCVTRL